MNVCVCVCVRVCVCDCFSLPGHYRYQRTEDMNVCVYVCVRVRVRVCVFVIFWAKVLALLEDRY